MTTTYVQRCVKCWQPWNGFAGSTCNQCKILEEQERHHRKIENFASTSSKQPSTWQDRRTAKINQEFDDEDLPWEEQPEWERDYTRRVAKSIQKEELFEERRVAQANKLGLDPDSEEAIYDMHVPRTPLEFIQETDWGLVFAWSWYIGLFVAILWFVYG